MWTQARSRGRPGASSTSACRAVRRPALPLRARARAGRRFQAQPGVQRFRWRFSAAAGGDRPGRLAGERPAGGRAGDGPRCSRAPAPASRTPGSGSRQASSATCSTPIRSRSRSPPGRLRPSGCGRMSGTLRRVPAGRGAVRADDRRGRRPAAPPVPAPPPGRGCGHPRRGAAGDVAPLPPARGALRLEPLPDRRGRPVTDTWYLFLNGLVKLPWVALIRRRRGARPDRPRRPRRATDLAVASEIRLPLFAAFRAGAISMAGRAGAQPERRRPARVCRAARRGARRPRRSRARPPAAAGPASRARRARLPRAAPARVRRRVRRAPGHAGEPGMAALADELVRAQLRQSHRDEDPAAERDGYRVRGMFEACASLLIRPSRRTSRRSCPGRCSSGRVADRRSCSST